MRPIRLVISAAEASEPVPIDISQNSVEVGVGVSLSAGATLTFSVEHTFDDIWSAAFDADTAVWYPNTGLTARSASTDGNYAFPVTAVRLNVTAHTTGSATMVVVQAGMPGR